MAKVEHRHHGRRQPSGTKWQLLSSEDIGASIDGEIMVPETPPKEGSPTTEDEEEEKEFRCMGRRQAEYHHRPPVWRVEVLDSLTPEVIEECASSEGLGVPLTPDEFTEWTDARNYDSDALPLGDEAVQRRIAMSETQLSTDISTASRTFPLKSGASASILTGLEPATSQANWLNRFPGAPGFQELPHPRNAWCCASTSRSTKLTPGSRVVYVGNSAFPGLAIHRFGEIWVVRRVCNATWAHCIRLAHDYDVAQNCESKVLILKPMNYAVRIFSAHIPLAALALEQHLAPYISDLQQSHKPLEPAVGSEVPCHQSDCLRSCFLDDLDVTAMNRRMLIALFMNISFEMNSRYGATNLAPGKGGCTAIHLLPPDAHLRGSIDAITYLLETPECRLCDPKQNDEVVQNQKRKKFKSTLRRRKPNEHVRRKVKSLFGSQTMSASSLKPN